MDDALEVAGALLKRLGLEEAYVYAYRRAHPYRHFGAVGTPSTQLYWRRVAVRILRLDRQASSATAAEPRRMPTLQLRTRRTYR